MNKKKEKIEEQLEEPKTRKVKILGKEIEVRRIAPSKEALKNITQYIKKREIVGHLAINPPHIDKFTRMMRANILREMALMNTAEREDFINKGPIDFVKDKDGRKKYSITCARCGDKVAYCWARDEKLTDWCDLHYISWHDKESWRGAMAVNVSPIDGRLGFECCCGEDTRDYRASTNLPPIQKELLVQYMMKHRDFGTKDSKFFASKDK